MIKPAYLQTNWRNFIDTNSYNEVIYPLYITPGGKVVIDADSIPMVPFPETIKIDYPYVLIDNWQIRLFPFNIRALDWMSTNTGKWLHERLNRETRLMLRDFWKKVMNIDENGPPVQI